MSFSEPTWGTLTVKLVSAEFDAPYLNGSAQNANSFCGLWLLEKVKWRRRKSKRARGASPQWDETWVFEDVRSDSKFAVDVYNVPDAGGADEFFGKVTISIEDALKAPVAAWRDLLPGKVQLNMSWQDQYPGDQLGERIQLTLPPVPGGGKRAPVVKTPLLEVPPPAPAPSARIVAAMATGGAEEEVEEEVAVPAAKAPLAARPKPAVPAASAPAGPSPGSHSRALAGLASLEAEALAMEEADDDFEEDVEEIEPAPAPPPAPPPKPAAPPAAKAEYFEFTHKGGTGHGPKENQDAFFLAQIDERNAVFGVLDGHGHDHGRIAAQAGAARCKDFLLDNFDRITLETAESVMTECFKAAHDAVFMAIKRQGNGIFEDPDTPGVLVQDVDDDEWPLGFDAADGGTTCSVGVLLDGRHLVYAAAGDSCSLLGVPNASKGAARTIELIPEHSPTNQNDWELRLHKTGVHVVFDHAAMFDDQPASLLPVFTKDADGGWHISEATLARADELGCGLKTERGDRASVVMTPENGRFSQMMLGVTRSVGDFYHQRYGVTWQPEVVIKDLAAECAADKSKSALLIIASDGVWDHWEFDDSMQALCDLEGMAVGKPITTRKRVMDFFEDTRQRGEDAFGDGADNLTGIVAVFTLPPA